MRPPESHGPKWTKFLSLSVLLTALSFWLYLPLASSRQSNEPARAAQSGQANPAGQAVAGAPAGPSGSPATAGRRGPAPIDFDDHDGFISLFDGSTLNGWTGDTDYWSVKDGAIFSESTCERPTGTIYLYWTGGEASEFELKALMKGTGTVNSGIQYRSWLAIDPNAPHNSRGPGAGRAGGPAGAPAAPEARGGAPAAAGAVNGRGRGPQCANPGTAPGRDPNRNEAQWNMGGPQYDFDENDNFPGQFYEQASGRGIIASPGMVVEADPGKQPRLLATLADKATLSSWFNKDDYNQEIIIARGHTYTQILNGHVASVFIDNNPRYFRSTGHIGFEIEGYGQIYIKDIWLKQYE